MLGMKGYTYRRYERGEIPLKATLLIEFSRHHKSIDRRGDGSETNELNNNK